jgi:hypothetical protein
MWCTPVELSPPEKTPSHIAVLWWVCHHPTLEPQQLKIKCIAQLLLTWEMIVLWFINAISASNKMNHHL